MEPEIPLLLGGMQEEVVDVDQVKGIQNVLVYIKSELVVADKSSYFKFWARLCGEGRFRDPTTGTSFVRSPEMKILTQ